MKPTPEQQQIIDTASGGHDLVIEAGAGTGKTSTLKMLSAAKRGNAMFPDRGLYVAYNRAIADDAKRSFPSNVQCKTAHSLAFATFGRAFAHRLQAPRVPIRETIKHLGINDGLTFGDLTLTKRALARIVIDTVGMFCHSAEREIEHWHVPHVRGIDDTRHRVELGNWVLPRARQAWREDLTQHDGRLRFTHDMYLKMWQLSGPQLGFDFVLLDEAQDANPVIADVVNNQTGAQRILVGDQSQAIYGWRGAVDAMAGFDGKRLQLSQSFRFGPPIADEANKWLELLEAPLRLSGYDQIDSVVQPFPTIYQDNGKIIPVGFARAVLCRSNAETIARAMAVIADGQRAAIVGGGSEIRRLAEAARSLMAGLGTDHPELCAFRTWDQVREYVDEDSAGRDLKVLVKIIDSHGPQAVIELTERLADESVADVVVSTAHKAKGREWPTVLIADDFAAPEDLDDLDRAEMMLAYVAVTRAQLVLDRGGLAWIDRWV